ncbi:MAG: penicillin-insensitive murein endopeptidase [Myxococcales bacterium]|nr:penicillin-insensitive murein endopeptidase [Myxococcales bacterium]
MPRPAPVPEPDPPPTVPPTTTACGRLKLFDSDGDGISNSVEDTNAARRYADLQTGRCDPDPTRPTGTPHSGQLSGALNLPDDGDGYVHFLGSDSADQDDWGSLQTLTCIEQVGRQLRENNLLLNVGDISLRGGGHFPPHASHQNGLDIDLRYIRKDRRSVPLDLRIEPQAYDADATKLVMDAFVKLCPVHIIFVDTDRIQFPIEDTPIFHANGHSNHAHIRLEAPQL